MSVKNVRLFLGGLNLTGNDVGDLDQLLQAEATSGNRSTYLVFLATPPAPGSMRGTAERLLDEVAPGTSPLKVFDQLGGFAVDLDDAQAGRLRLRREVGSIELDRPMRLDPPIAEPQPAPNGANGNVLPQALVRYANGTASTGELIPWGVRAVWQGRDISTTGNSGAGTYAFVIDSGVANTTGDLNLNTTWSKSFIPGETAFQDGLGHGTHVAGTIGALVNGVGVVGVAPGATIVSLKVFNSTGGGGTYLNIIDAINYAVSVITTNSLPLPNVVINLSLGGPVDSALNAAMINAANQGIRFAVAAGNSAVDANTASPATTGDHPNIYTVSAVDSNYVMAPFSNWDQVTTLDPTDSVDVAAPGVSVVSLSRLGNGATATMSGTSMAAPHVAGALLMGGVTAGDMVTPGISNLTANFGTAIPADQFAWAATFPTSTIPTPAPTPTYTLSTTAAAVNEGTTLNFAISTTGVTTGTTLYWTLAGTGISTTDFTSLTSLDGSSVLTNGSASISLNISADLLTEGNELLSVQLYSDAGRTQLVSTSSTVTINDSSLTPPPSSTPPASVTGQTFWGTTRNDTIIGGIGNDQIAGVTATGTTAANLGRGQIDVLTGGLGTDTFLLADIRGTFYNDGRATNQGSGDYARIMDFDHTIDKLQLRSGSQYLIRYNSAVSANEIFLGNGDNLFTNADELIGRLQGANITAVAGNTYTLSTTTSWTTWV